MEGERDALRERAAKLEAQAGALAAELETRGHGRGRRCRGVRRRDTAAARLQAERDALAERLATDARGRAANRGRGARPRRPRPTRASPRRSPAPGTPPTPSAAPTPRSPTRWTRPRPPRPRGCEAVADLGAAQAVAAQADLAITAAFEARDAAVARAEEAERERDAAWTRRPPRPPAIRRWPSWTPRRARRRAGRRVAEATAGQAEALAAEAQRQAETLAADAHRRAEVAELRADDAERRLGDVESARDDARAALARAEEHVGEEAATLRADLDLALAARDELQALLDQERESRELAERRLADVGPAQVVAQVPAVMTSPYSNGRPSLPPLEVAAAQAKAFAYSAPTEPEGPPPGFTPDALEDFDRALAKSSSPRAAGRAALQALATATGWKGGALWQPRDEGDFGCAETWSAYMSGLEAWETMAWRAHLEDGLVPAAAGSGEAHWADTDDMLACPRSRSAAWADLGTLATVPVVHPDGRVLAVLELVRETHDTADPELLATLTGVAVRLAERLGAIEQSSRRRAAGSSSSRDASMPGGCGASRRLPGRHDE